MKVFYLVDNCEVFPLKFLLYIVSLWSTFMYFAYFPKFMKQSVMASSCNHLSKLPLYNRQLYYIIAIDYQLCGKARQTFYKNLGGKKFDKLVKLQTIHQSFSPIFNGIF